MLYLFFISTEKQFDVILHFPEDYKNSKDEQGDMRNVSVEMCKKVYKDMVKEMDMIASQEDLYQQNVLEMYEIIDFFGLCTSH